MLAWSFSLLTSGQLHAFQWEQKRYKDLPYVGFDSFVEFYEFEQIGLKKVMSITEKELEFIHLKGPLGACYMRAGSREMYFNGRLFWLSLPVYKAENEKLYVSRVDLVKLLEPVLRPNDIKMRKECIGVVIDPGHGGADHGAKGKLGLREKKLNLDVAQRLREILKEQKIATVMTRYRDTFLTLEKRASLASKYKGFIFVSIHFNYSRSSKSKGVETYSLTPRFSPSTNDTRTRMRHSDRDKHPGNAMDELNVVLTNCIQQSLLNLSSKPFDRGIKRARFVVLRRSTLPSTLIEGGFLSNYSETKLLAKSSYRQEIAQRIAEGIKNYMALMNDEVTDLKAPQVQGLDLRQ